MNMAKHEGAAGDPDCSAGAAVAPLRAVAQVVALEPEGPDGHGVNWLAGKRPKPGDLLFAADAVARALAVKNEAETRELKAAQELDEAIIMLHNFADLCTEFCDHTPDSFNRQVMRIGNAARLLLNARKSGSSDLETSGIEDGAGFVYCWLVEEFGPNGNSTGRYMLDQGSLKVTADVYKARRLRRQQSAEFRALDMKALHKGDWRAVEHGFGA